MFKNLTENEAYTETNGVHCGFLTDMNAVYMRFVAGEHSWGFYLRWSPVTNRPYFRQEYYNIRREMVNRAHFRASFYQPDTKVTLKVQYIDKMTTEV